MQSARAILKLSHAAPRVDTGAETDFGLERRRRLMGFLYEEHLGDFLWKNASERDSVTAKRKENQLRVRNE
jgi:hypothetical protein